MLRTTVRLAVRGELALLIPERAAVTAAGRIAADNTARVRFVRIIAQCERRVAYHLPFMVKKSRGGLVPRLRHAE